MNLQQTSISKFVINHPCFSTNALCFVPATKLFKPQMLAIFTHGYTSSKHDLMTWATRLSEAGITTTIFDLPGHYLGSFNEINSLSDFQNHAHELFGLAYIETKNILVRHNLQLLDANANIATSSPFSPLKLILGGHSLGGLLALNCYQDLSLPTDLDITYLCIGLGLNPEVKVHLFDSEFYQKTLNIRKQLVSPHLDPKDVFPWIKNHKHDTHIKNKKIVLICGQDDVVVGKGGAGYLKSLLDPYNQVELIEPPRLPHHEPQLAASTIYHYLKEHF